MIPALTNAVKILARQKISNRKTMNTKQAVSNRIKELCEERNISVNAVAYISGMPTSTVQCMLNTKSKNPGIVNIKKLCDGFGITLGEFFSTPVFDALEQEIK